MRAVIPAIDRLRVICHTHGIPTFFSRFGYSHDYSDSGISLERPPASAVKDVQGIIRDSWDAQIVSELESRAHEAVIDKTRNSAFRGTNLETMLRKKGINHLILAGVGTNVCVESTARDSY